MPTGTLPRKEPAQQPPGAQIPAMVLCPQVPLRAARGLHCSAAARNSDSWLVPPPPEPRKGPGPTKALALHEELFQQAPAGARDKANFVRAVQNFGQHNVHKRGHVDFIYLALRKMREYGVERDLAVYNLLLDVFPKEVFQPRSIIQSIFIHYPRQQECGIAVLEQMESHGEARRLRAGEWVSSFSPVLGPSAAPGLCLAFSLCVCLAGLLPLTPLSQSLLCLSSLSSLPLTVPFNSDSVLPLCHQSPDFNSSCL